MLKMKRFDPTTPRIKYIQCLIWLLVAGNMKKIKVTFMVREHVNGQTIHERGIVDSLHKIKL
uniref:Uncharacterized protein n=1 Tax=Arundo donax TaxID=35708 RepID=A0A0A8YX29_ARUDO